jgi:hypothetical protein
MSYIPNLLMRLSLAALVMVVAFLWFPEWLGVLGLLFGFLLVVVIEKTVQTQSFVKDIHLFTLFVFMIILSYMILMLTCSFSIVATNQCELRNKEVFLLSAVLYPAASIIPLYIFGWIPRHIRNWMRKY